MADIVAPPVEPQSGQAVEPATPNTSEPERDPRAEREAHVQHTPGGLPAVPIALLTANTAVAGAAAASLAAGPLVALLAAGTTVTALTVGSKVRRRQDNRRGRTLPQARQGQIGTWGRTPRQRTAHGQVGTAAGGRHAQRGLRAVNPYTGQPVPAGRSGVRRGARGAVQQVRAMREAHRAAVPSRAGRREQRTQDRHRIADARRQAQRQARQQRAAVGGRGPRALAARAAASPRAQARQARRDAARQAKRSEKGQAGAERVTAKSHELRRRPVRRAARMRLHRSAARFHARRAAHGLLALPVMLLGVLTTWAGRKLGIPSWLHPGHRLLRWLNAKAWRARWHRDQQIHNDLMEQEAAITAAEAQENSATPVPEDGPGRAVERAPLSHNANTNLGVHVTTPAAGFNFADAAADMEAQAQSFEPDGMMQVLAAFEGLPEAMQSIARTFQILAERSDAEFPLEKEVGEALNDVFQHLQQVIGACEEVGATMRRVHEQDIRRHEDPRNGEDKWDTDNN